MIKLYIIASVTDGVGLEIETFYEPGQVTKRMKALVDSGFRKPKPNESPEDYHAAYYEWVREENDNTCDTDIALQIEEIPVPTATKLPAEPKTQHPENDTTIRGVLHPDLDDEQLALLMALRLWRKNIGEEQDKHLFLIFSDATLINIAKAKPQVQADLTKIKGIGDQKATLYGDDLLAICNAFN